MSSLDVKMHFRRLSRMMDAMAEVAGGTGHAATTGRLRENIVNSFLRPHLAKNLSVKSGVIIDSKGGKSRQQDCIIVDNRLPLIDVGDEQEAVVIAESVVATLEVKSFLSRSEMESTLLSIEKTKGLFRSGQQLLTKNGISAKIDRALPILTYLFAYDGVGLENIGQQISEHTIERHDGGLAPEAVCILKKGIIERSSLMPTISGRNVTLPPISSVKLEMKTLQKDALFAFYRRFIDDVLSLRIEHYDIDSYYSDSGLE